MFAGFLLLILIRFMFWAFFVLTAIVLAFAAIIGMGFAYAVRPRNPERAGTLYDASRLLIGRAVDTAKFADNHRRWVLPNTQHSKRYR